MRLPQVYCLVIATMRRTPVRMVTNRLHTNLVTLAHHQISPVATPVRGCFDLEDIFPSWDIPPSSELCFEWRNLRANSTIHTTSRRRSALMQVVGPDMRVAWDVAKRVSSSVPSCVATGIVKVLANFHPSLWPKRSVISVPREFEVMHLTDIICAGIAATIVGVVTNRLHADSSAFRAHQVFDVALDVIEVEPLELPLTMGHAVSRAEGPYDGLWPPRSGARDSVRVLAHAFPVMTISAIITKSIAGMGALCIETLIVESVHHITPVVGIETSIMSVSPVTEMVVMSKINGAIVILAIMTVVTQRLCSDSLALPSHHFLETLSVGIRREEEKLVDSFFHFMSSLH